MTGLTAGPDGPPGTGVRLGAGEGVAGGAGVAARLQAPNTMARIAAVIVTRGGAAGRRGAVTAAS
jgi:hypothetical protein